MRRKLQFLMEWLEKPVFPKISIIDKHCFCKEF